MYGTYRQKVDQKKQGTGEFPGGPVIRNLCFQYRSSVQSSTGGTDSIPGQGIKIPQAAWQKTNKTKTNKKHTKIKTKKKTKPQSAAFWLRNVEHLYPETTT